MRLLGNSIWSSLRRRSFTPIGEIEGSCYRAVSDLAGVEAFFADHAYIPDEDPEDEGGIRANCYVCGKESIFRVRPSPDSGPINWRENLHCDACGLMARWRNSIHVLDIVLRPRKRDRIYITEQVTDLYRCLAQRHPHLVGSEFHVDLERGKVHQVGVHNVRVEDVTELTFPARSFHSVLSFDVLEHLAEYRAALREFYRVLKIGGQLLISVPFNFTERNERRARVGSEGQIEHLLEPQYHGDPLLGGGVLCYQDFGTELLADFIRAGFTDSFMVCINSGQWAYPGAHVYFVGRKRE